MTVNINENISIRQEIAKYKTLWYNNLKHYDYIMFIGKVGRVSSRISIEGYYISQIISVFYYIDQIVMV